MQIKSTRAAVFSLTLCSSSFCTALDEFQHYYLKSQSDLHARCQSSYRLLYPNREQPLSELLNWCRQRGIIRLENPLEVLEPVQTIQGGIELKKGRFESALTSNNEQVILGALLWFYDHPDQKPPLSLLLKLANQAKRKSIRLLCEYLLSKSACFYPGPRFSEAQIQGWLNSIELDNPAVVVSLLHGPWNSVTVSASLALMAIDSREDLEFSSRIVLRQPELIGELIKSESMTNHRRDILQIFSYIPEVSEFLKHGK